MPEHPNPRPRPHPWACPRERERAAPQRAVVPYAELSVTTNFTFLTGASHPEEMVEQAAALGQHAIAIADHNTLAGIVRAHVAAEQVGIPLAVGSRLVMKTDLRTPAARIPADGDRIEVLAFPTDRASYGRLCRLLTVGRRRAEKGACDLCVHDLLEHEEGLLAVVVPPREIDQRFLETLAGLRRVFDDDRLSLAASRRFDGHDQARLARLAALAEVNAVPLVATNDVRYHVPSRRPLHDVVTCIRHGCTTETAGWRLEPHAERDLKRPEDMARLWSECLADGGRAIARSVEIATRAAAFNLNELRYAYPKEVCPAGWTAMEHLRALTLAGAVERYPKGIPESVRNHLDHEFELIDELEYAPYFLTVHDLVRFARARSIVCQGRGAAANSVVCYCLGVTAVDPTRIDVLFERFISRERNEPPDIDIDFEHERREEVIQYLYQKYGRDRAALTAVVITYRGRSAVRDVGKALGFSLDLVDQLAKNVDWWRNNHDDRAWRELGLDPSSPGLKLWRSLVEEIIGFPRHLSQHVGGFVITESPLSELVPIENAAMADRTVIEWDKDDIDAMGMLKVDVLGLGMMTCVRKAIDLVNEVASAQVDVGGRTPLTLATVPAEDERVYDMICAADTVGVFQIESRAQMSMLPRLRPRRFYDLVIEVAIVRPGPIQGKMVHPYLRRRNGEEPVVYPSDAVERVLGKTLGVPLFQEQAMSLAVVAAGFTLGEADQLRRAMAAWKRKGNQMKKFSQRLVDGMLARGYDREFADRCVAQIHGFSEYGFPESHAASFALIVYVSAWLKCHHPAAFAAALLNSQPMGFYAPAQIVRDARDHGVEVRPVDIAYSQWDCTLEPGETGWRTPALRLGMRLVKRLSRPDAEAVVDAMRAKGPFASVERLRRVSGVSATVLRKLASADAFRFMDMERSPALWAVRNLHDDVLPMFAHLEDPPPEPAACLPEVPLARQVAHDYETTHLSLKAHPMGFLRAGLTGQGVLTAGEVADTEASPHGKPVAVAGLVLVRQRPATAAGIVFMTIEDETGIANLIVRPKIYETYRRIARHGVAIVAYGRIERQGAVVHVLVKRFDSLDERLADIVAGNGADPAGIELKPASQRRPPVVKSRDFR